MWQWDLFLFWMDFVKSQSCRGGHFPNMEILELGQLANKVNQY